MFAAVITTIQEPTRGVVKLVEKLAECGGLLVVAGDKQGPAHFQSQHFAEGGRIDFLALADQHASEFDLARKLPVGSYSRKNVAYLHAIAAAQISFMKLTTTTPRLIHGSFVPSPWPLLGLSVGQMDDG